MEKVQSYDVVVVGGGAAGIAAAVGAAQAAPPVCWWNAMEAWAAGHQCQRGLLLRFLYPQQSPQQIVRGVGPAGTGAAS